MFLKIYTELAVDFERVREAMQGRPRVWLDGLAEYVDQQGQRMLVEVGLDVGGHPIRRSAWVEIGQAISADRVASLPLWLEVQDHQGLFPSFAGNLDAAWLGDRRTHLSLSAWYDPPFGFLGTMADRALMHRVAEAVAHHFLERVAERLSARSVAGVDFRIGENHPSVAGLR